MIIKGINCESLFIDDASFYDGSVWTPIKIAPNAADQYLWKLAKGIAREKAGILKPGSIGVVARQADEARLAIEAEAEQVGVPLQWMGQDFDARRSATARSASTTSKSDSE